MIEQAGQALAHREAAEFALALVPGVAAPVAQHRFLLRNRGAVSTQDFTRVRSSHMPEPRLICVRD